MCDLGPLLRLEVMASQAWGSPGSGGPTGYPDPMQTLTPFVSPCSGPWWRPTCGKSVVWNSSCGSSKASGMQPSPARAPHLPLPHLVLIWTCTTWHCEGDLA